MKIKKIETNEITPEAKASLKKRVITAIVFAAIAAPCIILGNWFFFAFIVVLSIFSAYELVHVMGLQGKLKIVVYVFTIVLLLALTNYIFFRNNWELMKAGQSTTAWEFVNNGFINIDLSSMLIIVTAIIFFIMCFATEKMSLFNVFYLITMLIVISLGMQSFLYLRFSPFAAWKVADPSYASSSSFPYLGSLLLILYLAIGVMMNDIGAYFVGMLFGKHKLNPRISPKKTWEGFFGGIIISAICSITFALAMAAVNQPILPRFKLNQWYWILLISIVMPLAGVIGDFVFSAIKRNFGIKDFSNILPGHGGILDRIDSLLFAGGSVAAMIAFMDFVQPIIQNISEVA